MIRFTLLRFLKGCYELCLCPAINFYSADSIIHLHRGSWDASSTDESSIYLKYTQISLIYVWTATDWVWMFISLGGNLALRDDRSLWVFCRGLREVPQDRLSSTDCEKLMLLAFQTWTSRSSGVSTAAIFEYCHCVTKPRLASRRK